MARTRAVGADTERCTRSRMKRSAWPTSSGSRRARAVRRCACPRRVAARMVERTAFARRCRREALGAVDERRAARRFLLIWRAGIGSTMEAIQAARASASSARARPYLRSSSDTSSRVARVRSLLAQAPERAMRRSSRPQAACALHAAAAPRGLARASTFSPSVMSPDCSSRRSRPPRSRLRSSREAQQRAARPRERGRDAGARA